MKKLLILFLFLFTAGSVSAQTEKSNKNSDKNKKTAVETQTTVVNSPASVTSLTITKTAAPMDLAKAALAVYGGEKFRLMKTLIVSGTADVSGSPTMTFPATFAMIYSGDKYRLEISNPFTPFKQIYDGQQTQSSINGFSLPPINRLGLPLLAKIEEKDFTVSALPDKNKKKLGFRITSPEGYYTDFFLDEKTGLVKGYEASYTFGDRTVTTAVEIDKLRDVEGVKVPERYAQRLETGTFTVYVNFKAKDISVNSTVSDDVFSLSK